MANYYTFLCFEIQLSAEALTYLKELEQDHIQGHETPEHPLKHKESKKLYGFGVEVGTGCEFKDQGDGRVLVESDEGTNVYVLASVLQAVLKKFGGEPIAFDWSDWCDKMRKGAFGGGACFITTRHITWMSTEQWIGRRLRSLEKRRSA